MAKFELKFKDVEDDFTIKVEQYEVDKSLIEISIYDCYIKKSTRIYLDKSTSIKLAKTLRTEINKITESEVKNG